jgi:MoxR-like ATPase
MMTAVSDPPAEANGVGDTAAARAAVAQATAPPVDLASAVKAFTAAADETKDVVVESDEYVDALTLATASRTHLYVAGSGGVGKTFGSERWGEHFGVETFYVQFRNDTKREEIFGPLSMTALQADLYQHVTKGYLPEAVLAVLDEFKDAGRFTRQLLNVLNERWFVNGGVRTTVPLVTAIGATNFWIEEQELEALFDRFAQRIVQEPVKTSAGFKKILGAQVARGAGAKRQRTIVTPEQLAAIHAAVDACTVSPDVLTEVDKLRKAAQGENLYMSPRRWGEGVKLAQASAVLRGDTEVILDDLRTYARVLPNHPDDFKAARDLCKAFRDKFTEAVEESRAALTALIAEVQPQRDAVAGGAPADMSVPTNVSKSMKELKQRIDGARSANAGRDMTALDKVVSDLGDVEQFLHRAVLGG